MPGVVSHAVEMPNALVDVVLLVGMDDNTALVPLDKVSYFFCYKTRFVFLPTQSQKSRSIL